VGKDLRIPPLLQIAGKHEGARWHEASNGLKATPFVGTHRERYFKPHLA
jgi:hypothetical protein